MICKNNIITKFIILMIIGACFFFSFFNNKVSADESLTISLEGSEEVELFLGTKYTEAGAYAYDTIDGDLTSAIQIDSTSINTEVEGNYEVKYSVTNSRMETAEKIRKVIVRDQTSETSTRFIKINSNDNEFSKDGVYPNYSDTSNRVYKIINLKDGGFLAIGSIKGTNQSYALSAYVAKYDYNFELLWHKQYSPISETQNCFVYDAIENSKGHFILDICYGNNVYIILVDENGEVLTSSPMYFQYKLTNIEKKTDTDYILLGSNTQYYYEFSINYENNIPSIINKTQKTPFITFYAGTPSCSNDKGVYNNGKIYYTNSNTTLCNLCYYDINDGSIKISDIRLSKGKFEIVGNYIYCLDDYNKLIKADLNLNIISEKSIDNACYNAAFCVSSDYIIFLDSEIKTKVYYYSLDDFELVYTNILDKELVNVEGINYSYGNTYICGNIYDDYYYLYIVKLRPYVDITFEDTNFFVYEDNFYETGTKASGIGLDAYHLFNVRGDSPTGLCGIYRIELTYALIFDSKTHFYTVPRIVELKPKTSVDDGKIYKGSKLIEASGGDITINGSPFENSKVYNDPGHYQLIISGYEDYKKTYDFDIELEVSNLEDGGVYIEKVTPYISGGECFLNEVEYNIGDEIKGPGYYCLQIVSHDSTFEYNFTIEPEKLNVNDGFNYSLPLIPAITSGEIKINDEVYESGTLFYKPGNHTMRIEGPGNYEKIISFSIIAGSNIDDNVSYELEKEILFCGDSATLNGTSIENQHIVDEIGQYQLIVLNGSEELVYNFLIEPIVKGIEDGKEYDENVTIEIEGDFTEIKLNGNVVTLTDNKLSIDEVGNYTLTIYGENDYSKNYNFVINPVVSGINDGKSYPFSISYEIHGNCKKILLNDEETNSIGDITKSGQNILTILGVNEYEKEYNVKIIKDIINIEEDAVYEAPIIPILYEQDLIYILDGDLYQKNTPINKVGNHIFVIQNEEIGYYREIHFTVEVVFENEVDHAIDSFEPKFLGEAQFYLNSEIVEDINNVCIKAVGNNKIRIVGYNGYVKEYTIFIEKNLYINDVYYDSFELDYDISIVNIKIDGLTYAPNSNIEKIGNHTLTVCGEGNYNKDYNFTIMPILIGKNDTSIYIESVTFNINDSSSTIKIDEKIYNKGEIYQIVGYHNLKIEGSNDYLFEYSFKIIENPLTFENNGKYVNNVTISIDKIAKKITLDGSTIQNGDKCSIVGNHKISVYGTGGYTNEYRILVEPTISGIEEGKFYHGNVSWEINGIAKCKLDGTDIDVNSSTNIVGHHTLLIYSDYNYSKSIHFCVTPELYGVVDGEEYISSVTFTSENCELYLNDEKLDSNSYTVSLIGNHKLIIKGTNDYLKEIKFCVRENPLGLSVEDEFDTLILHGLDNTISYLDGYLTKNGASVSKPGIHLLQVTGVGGYSNDYFFTINARPSFYGNVINCPNCTIKLNGNEVRNFTDITDIGKNEITILGSNGYEKTFYVDIASNCNISNNSTYENRKLIKKLNARMFIDGDEIFEDTYVEENGEHKLVIIGVGGYEETITFNIHNNNIAYSLIFSAVILVFITFFVVLIIVRKKVI